MNKKERIQRVLEYFSAQQPETTTELNYGSVFQLLCAVVLSAQCTDKRVNTVTPALFNIYPTPQELANATAEDVKSIISSISYPNSKAANLVAMAKKIVEEHDGRVPETFDQLTSLPGVGRKTANVILAVAFNIPAMPVDTHVFRVSRRLGIVPLSADTPEKVERNLVKHIAPEILANAHHWILLHGRYICTARKPQCEKCGIAHLCKDYQHNKTITF